MTLSTRSWAHALEHSATVLHKSPRLRYVYVYRWHWFKDSIHGGIKWCHQASKIGVALSPTLPSCPSENIPYRGGQHFRRHNQRGSRYLVSHKILFKARSWYKKLLVFLLLKAKAFSSYISTKTNNFQQYTTKDFCLLYINQLHTLKHKFYSFTAAVVSFHDFLWVLFLCTPGKKFFHLIVA